MLGLKDMSNSFWRWVLGLIYIFAVAIIWIAASFVVQSVVDAGVSPFLITYICNSLFVIYIPVVEITRYFEDTIGSLWPWKSSKNDSHIKRSGDYEKVVLLGESDLSIKADSLHSSEIIKKEEMSQQGTHIVLEPESEFNETEGILSGEANPHILSEVAKFGEDSDKQVDSKGRWTRKRVAKASLLICPFWFLAQLTFNLSLKYTTVTSNTILSSASSLFTFLVSLLFLGEKFTWMKLISVLLCMGGTIIVSLGDSETGLSAIATKPLLGDTFALVSAGLYAVYITLIRKKIPDDDGKGGNASMAQFLGFLGLFNFLIFLPVALILIFTKFEPIHLLTWKQLGLIVGKGLLDNVLSDYLWAKAVLLTTTTVATAGLTIQVPLAAIVDSITGNAPHLMDYLGAVAVMVGFVGINIPYDAVFSSKGTDLEKEDENGNTVIHCDTNLPASKDAASIS